MVPSHKTVVQQLSPIVFADILSDCMTLSTDHFQAELHGDDFVSLITIFVALCFSQ